MCVFAGYVLMSAVTPWCRFLNQFSSSTFVCHILSQMQLKSSRGFQVFRRAPLPPRGFAQVPKNGGFRRFVSGVLSQRSVYLRGGSLCVKNASAPVKHTDGVGFPRSGLHACRHADYNWVEEQAGDGTYFTRGGHGVHASEGRGRQVAAVGSSSGQSLSSE